MSKFSLEFALFLILNAFSTQIVGRIVTESNDKSGKTVSTSQSRLCGTVRTSDGKTVFLREGIPPSVEEFEKVHERKMKHAKLNPERKCAISICGFSSWRTGEYLDCELFQTASTADSGVYNDNYNTSALMCGCKHGDEDCSNDCPSQASEMNWKGNECAVMFQERDCKSCYFQPVYLSNGEHFIKNYSRHIVSVIVRENCRLQQNVPAFGTVNFRFAPKSSQTKMYAGGSTFDYVTSAYQSDPEIFNCSCDGDLLDSHLDSSTPHTVSVSSSSPVTHLPRNSVPQDPDVEDGEGMAKEVTYLIIGGVVIILFAAIFAGMYVWRKWCTSISNNEEFETVNDEFHEESGTVNNKFKEEFQPVQNEELNEEFETVKNNFKEEFKPVKNDLNEEFELVKNDFNEEFKPVKNEFNEEFETLKNKFNEQCRPENRISRSLFHIKNESYKKPLGIGRYGIVYRGHLRHESDGLFDVIAVKIVYWSDSPDSITLAFFREIKNFQKIGSGHINILKFLGAHCAVDGLFLLTEYCEGGSLADHISALRKEILVETPPHIDGIPLDSGYVVTDAAAENQCMEKRRQLKLSGGLLSQIYDWCRQIAIGMEFLHSEGIIHSDLAIRNILRRNGVIKICDFGLSKDLFVQSLISGDFPLNSVAPECSKDSKFQSQVTKYVDIWSYGCTIWEILTLGGNLYSDVQDVGPLKFKKVCEVLSNGYRHPNPELAPDFLYKEVLLKCWEENPESRPSFSFWHNYFHGLKIAENDGNEDEIENADEL